MRYQLFYTEKSLDDISRLPKKIGIRIFDKLAWYRDNDPLHFAKKLTNFENGMYRWRVGDYRIVFDIDEKGSICILMILAVKHRKDVYDA